ncbi:MAG: hypothetical protein CM15mP21_3330 [Hyphomicrobiales bacterium]|nr:MAG: hypothetical protein CM15mP21_3330 [Hyphomicrobiales bacterium]
MLAGDVGAPVELTGFARFELGEGVDKGEPILRLSCGGGQQRLAIFVSPTTGNRARLMALIRQRSSA